MRRNSARCDSWSRPALDAIAIELGRMVGEEERAAAALGDVADEVHRLLQGDIPHDL
jgi:hypothetical protein